jgi:multidrug efflux pump subunit AcrB
MMNRNPYESIIVWFANNHVAANLLMAILLAGGIWSVFTIKKEIQPRIETNMIEIGMPFLGATPEDVEEGVLVKIEESIQDIEGIKEITSFARRNYGSVSVEVLQDYDVVEVMNEVKNRVDAIPTFPDNTEKPVISRSQMQQQTLMVTVYGDVNERTLKEYAKQVRNEVVTLPGVSRAEILGSRDYEISIEVSEFTLQEYGLTLAEVSQAIPGILKKSSSAPMRTEHASCSRTSPISMTVSLNPTASRNTTANRPLPSRFFRWVTRVNSIFPGP